MREFLKIGQLSVNIYGVMVAAGIAAGIFIMSREAKRKELDKDKLFYLAIFTIIAAIIGARIYYIIGFNLGYYLKNPLEMLHVNAGGLSIQGALIGGILFAVVYTKKSGLPFWETADAFAPGIAIGQAVGRIGCDVFGIPMSTIYPWGIKVSSQILHPAQMYEMILDLILFTYLWRKRGRLKYKGQLFINYVIGFSLNRAIVEFFRSNPVIIKPFTIAHVTSFVIIIIAVIAGRIVKGRYQIEQNNLTDETVRVPLYQYALIILVGIVGMVIYYLVNSNL